MKIFFSPLWNFKSEQLAFYGNFRGADQANDLLLMISLMSTPSWTGDIHQAEKSNLQQILSSSEFSESDSEHLYKETSKDKVRQVYDEKQKLL